MCKWGKKVLVKGGCEYTKSKTCSAVLLSISLSLCNKLNIEVKRCRLMSPFEAPVLCPLLSRLLQRFWALWSPLWAFAFDCTSVQSELSVHSNANSLVSNFLKTHLKKNLWIVKNYFTCVALVCLNSSSSCPQNRHIMHQSYTINSGDYGQDQESLQ